LNTKFTATLAQHVQQTHNLKNEINFYATTAFLNKNEFNGDCLLNFFKLLQKKANASIF
jgi:hypothetical protein